MTQMKFEAELKTWIKVYCSEADQEMAFNSLKIFLDEASDRNPRLCQCGNIMQAITEKDGTLSKYSYQCNTPDCIIHKKGLILSIG